MNVPLDEVLTTGIRFSHEYDFGSTTELVLEVIARGDPMGKKGSVKLLARNDPPDIRCRTCGSPAAVICIECQEEIGKQEDVEKMYHCEQCVDKHAKHRHGDEEMRLPVVNSPRMGVCGYTR